MRFLYGAIFYILAAVILGATGMAITRRNQVHAVLYLVLSFFGTALLFYLLGAPMLAVFEIIIYAGAIMVLFLFIIMTLKTDDPAIGKFPFRQWVLPGVLGITSLCVAGILIAKDPTAGVKLRAATASPAQFGHFLFEHYWFPVEIVSFLLFVGLVGALYLGRQEKKQQIRSDKEYP